MEFNQLNQIEKSSEALEEVSDDLETVGNESAEPKKSFYRSPMETNVGRRLL